VTEERGGRVVPFVDAATLAIRRQAVRRVRERGIFGLPPELDGFEDGIPHGRKE
jgi:formate-dependent phosphoribosylglycinamide formyltransferase (GAR transformylase)